MTALSNTINQYLMNYSGLSKLSWYGVLLTLVEAALGGVSFFLSLYFVEVLNLEVTTAGLIISFYGFGTIIGGIVGGKLADRISPIPISILGLLVEGTAFLVLTKLRTSNLLIIDMFIIGFASYIFITSTTFWILNNCDKDEKLKAINILTVASNLGIGLSAFIVSLLSYFGFQFYFILNAVLFFLSGIFLYFLKVQQVTVTSHKSLPSTLKDISMKNLDTAENNKFILRLVLINLFLVGLMVAQLGTTCSIYINEKFAEMGINGVSFLFGINSFLVILFQAPIVNWFGKFNKLIVAGIGAFLIGLSMLILAFTYIYSLAVISRVIYTIGEMLFFSTAQLVCYENGAEEKKGHSLGMFRMTYAASIVLGPTIGSYVYKYFGANMLWYNCGMIGGLCLICCYKSKKFYTF